MTQRVVVTGIGVTSSIGHSVEESSRALREGRHGVRYVEDWDHIHDLQGRLGGPVEGIDYKSLYPRRTRRTMGPVAMLAVHSTEQAVSQAGLEKEALRSERTGVAFGSTSGSSSEVEKFSKPLALNQSMKGLESNAYFRLMTHTCAVNVGHFYRSQGRIIPTCTACTSGSQAVGTGYELIRDGIQDVMLCGGAEEMHYTTAVTFDLLMATSIHFNDRPDESPRPFDARRDGLVIGEGAAAVVLESLEHAKERGAEILAEVRGYGNNCDGSHLTMPHQDGMKRVMSLSLRDARVSPDAIDYVNGHGTGTEIGDVAESQATQEIFGRPVPFSTQKGYVGHTLGACGAMELAWTVDMMRGGWIAPCRNLDEIDERCHGLDYVRETRSKKLGLVMTNNFAFGGINTSLVLGPRP